MLRLYSLAWYLAMPLVLLRLWWRGRKEVGYRQHLAERLGWYRAVKPSPGVPVAPLIWVHAVSVGETRAAEPLIQALLLRYPSHHILLSHMTPTGRATGQALFGDAIARLRLQQCYLPYDTGWLVSRFLRQFKPRICILMETEVWPNLIAQCVRLRVPVALVNARLSARSLSKAERFSKLLLPAARAITCVAAQTDADAERVRQLGAAQVHVTGSIKFDVTPAAAVLAQGAALRTAIGQRPVLLCANTRDGEEALILDALSQLSVANALLILVPRHPQRFNAVAKMIEARGLALCRRSALGEDLTTANATLAPQVQVLLGDSMGEMFAYYSACDLAFVGGSLLPLGGHNLIEACALGKPVLLGPHTFNFGVISEEAVAAGAALRVADADAIMLHASQLLTMTERRHVIGAAAQAFALQHRGACGRTLDLLQPLLKD
ncbi:MAG: lipid IV(A) 3-deoxy-D-manno-octulosonic acid transferase [Pseudomonadota bacterium]